MLAIFDGRVAKRPECLKTPHKNAVSALKDDFLVKHFTSLYPGSVVVSSDAAFTFAYSLDASPSSHLERYHFAQTDDLYCMYQGFITNCDAVKRDFKLSEIDDEGIVMIRAFQILGLLDKRVPKKAVLEEMSRNCISVFYEFPSKLVVVAGGSYHDLPIYWGIDARFNLVISNNEKVVEKACGCFRAFLHGQVYACCMGRTGQEALFSNKQLPYKVDFTDKYFPISRPTKAISKLILQADKDSSKSCTEIWEPPLPGFFKINTAAVKFNNGMLGMGMVIRNSKGEVEFAATSKKTYSSSEFAPELQAFIEGFCTALALELRCFVYESVPLNLEMTYKGSELETIEMVVSRLGDHIDKNVHEFSVSFVSSSANKAAHRLAFLGKTERRIFWKETPESIADIVESERPTIPDTFSSEFQELEL